MMPIPDEVIKGSLEWTEQPAEINQRTGEPTTIKRVWEGPQATAVSKTQELALQYNPNDIRTRMGVPARIEIDLTGSRNMTSPYDYQDPDDDVLFQVMWAIKWQEVQRDIRAHGYYNESADSQKYMAEIDLAIRKGKANDTDWDTKYSATHLNAYRDDKQKGINFYVVKAPSIRATLLLSMTSLFAVPQMPIGKIISWNDIKLPYSGSFPTPGSAKIVQPTIHYYRGYDDGTPAGWSDLPVNQWMVNPVEREFTQYPRRMLMHFTWEGAVTWNSHLYDGGIG